MNTLLPEFCITVDDVVHDLLSSAGDEEPPVFPLEIAKSMNLEIIWDRGQMGRGRRKSLAGKSVLFIQPDDRPERLNWAIAHEIGESICYRIFSRANLEIDETDGPNREQMANLIASRLLLPTEWFQEQCEACDNDLSELKGIFSTASHELIATRWLDFSAPCIISVVDNGKVTRRRSNGASPGWQLTAVEYSTWQDCHRTESAIDLRDEESNLRVRCWPVHEADWKREILRTTPLEMDV